MSRIGERRDPSRLATQQRRPDASVIGEHLPREGGGDGDDGDGEPEGERRARLAEGHRSGGQFVEEHDRLVAGSERSRHEGGDGASAPVPVVSYPLGHRRGSSRVSGACRLLIRMHFGIDGSTSTNDAMCTKRIDTPDLLDTGSLLVPDCPIV